MRPETAVRKQDRGLRVFQQGVVTRLQPRACENVVYAFERGVGALVCSLLLKLKLANIEPFWSPAALARGLSNEAIGKELWVAEQTVKFHLTNIYRKLGVSNRTEAARLAYQNGLVESPLDDH